MSKTQLLAKYIGFNEYLIKSLNLIQVIWEVLYKYIRYFHYSRKEK